MVDHLEHLLAQQVRREAVIHAGDGVQYQHGEGVDAAADHGEGAVVAGADDGAEHAGEYAQRAAHDVGDHIRDFLAAGVVWQLPGGQGNAMHEAITSYTGNWI